jgi:hypothetical protein
MKELAFIGFILIVLLYTGLQHILNWGFRTAVAKENEGLGFGTIISQIIIVIIFIAFLLSWVSIK